MAKKTQIVPYFPKGIMKTTGQIWDSPNGLWRIQEVFVLPKESLHQAEGRIAGAVIRNSDFFGCVYLNKYGEFENDRWFVFPKYVKDKAISMMMAQVNKPAKKTTAKKKPVRRL